MPRQKQRGLPADEKDLMMYLVDIMTSLAGAEYQKPLATNCATTLVGHVKRWRRQRNGGESIYFYIAFRAMISDK